MVELGVEFPEPCAIAAGSFHSLVIGKYVRRKSSEDEENAGNAHSHDKSEVHSFRVYAFGNNKNRALGVHEDARQADPGTLLDRLNKGPGTQIFPEPWEVKAFQNSEITHISSGGHHSVFVERRGANQSGGQVWACGLGLNGRLGVPRPRTASECTELLREGWKRVGRTDSMESMVATLLDTKNNPKWSVPFPVSVAFPTTDKIVHLSCGIDHTLALTSRGVVYAWGVGDNGQLGDGSTDDKWEPKLVLIPAEARIRMVAAGTKHSMALTKEGQIFAWGHGGNGRLGLGEKLEAALEPAPVTLTGMGAADLQMRWIAAGEAHSASADVVGRVFCWGAGSHGRTGHGEDMDAPVPKHVQSLGSYPCVQVELGTLHSLALTSKGEVYGWGAGAASGCIDGSGVPKAIGLGHSTADEFLANKEKGRVIQIVAGSFHSLALRDDGYVFSWGMGSQGRLGLSSERISEARLSDETQPALIGDNIKEFIGWNPQTGYDSISGSNATKSFALADNSQQQVRKASEINVSKRKLYCGGMHSAYISGPEVYSWGSAEFGQPGHGNTEDSWTPSPIQFLHHRSKIVSLALGLEHSFAISSTRELFAWGRNHCGQLGLGSTRDMTSLQKVEGLLDVIGVSAGEDHSAAVLFSGALYTWGSAESGKLGHGASMRYGGTVQVPRQVRIGALRIAKVNCGIQHSAAIGGDGELYTFGAGWFGRLGLGDMQNQYSLEQVRCFSETFDATTETIPACSVEDVQCATYHTCIISRDGKLWVSGRDISVCATDHIKIPSLFELPHEPTGEDPRIQMISTAGLHTLALSRQGTLFAWGDNRSGQLGCGSEAHRLSEPVVVSLDSFRVCASVAAKKYDKLVSREAAAKRISKFGDRYNSETRANIIEIATGPAHSLVLLESGDVCAFGLRSGGRLGLSVSDEVEGEGKSVRTPDLVAGEWLEDFVQEDRLLEDDKTNIGDVVKGGENKVTVAHAEKGIKNYGEDIAELQQSLRAEPPDRTEEGLRQKEAKLASDYQEYIQGIFSLWDKPKDETVPCEWTLRALQARLDTSVCQNLMRMGLGEDYPTVNQMLNSEISKSLVHFEDLVWALTQQPCYLARLATKTNDWDLFLRVTKAIFQNMDDNRTRHLFMALCRRIGRDEVKKRDKTIKGSIETTFDSRRSLVSRLTQQVISNPYFRDFHALLFNIGNPDSLLAIILKHTYQEKLHTADKSEQGGGKQKKAKKSNDDERDAPVDVLFAFQEQDLLKFESTTNKYQKGPINMDEEMDREKIEHLRTRLQDHLRHFQSFLGVLSNAGGDEVPSQLPKHTFAGFVDNLKAQKCMQCIWKVFRRLTDLLAEHLHERESNFMQEDQQREAYEPVVRLFISDVLGHVLENHQTLMTFDQSQLLTKACHNAVRTGFEEEKGVSKKAKTVLTKVRYNLTQLGMFLKATANDSFSAQQSQVHGFGKAIKEGCVYNLFKKRSQQYEDNTETMVTIDLYASHYNMSETYVMLTTKDLLLLSNDLWKYANCNRSEEGVCALPPQRLFDDEMYQILDRIMPQSYDGQDEKKNQQDRAWRPEILAEVEHSSVTHNFTVRHRFLEHHRDLCFCRECEAPIPRTLAPLEQRSRTDLRLIKTYKPLEGPLVEGTPTSWFPDLQALIRNKELPAIRSKEFLSLKFEFEEFQKQMIMDLKETTNEKNVSNPDDYQLVAQIEKGKRLLELVKTRMPGTPRPEQVFLEFVHEGFQRRAAHRKYLDAVEEGLRDIKDAQTHYNTRLDKSITTLRKTVDMSEQMQLPGVIRNKASEKGVRLKYLESGVAAKKIKNDGQVDPNMKKVPCATHTLYWLRYKGVIARMGTGELGSGRLTPDDFKFISFNFECLESGDWHIQVIHDGKEQGKQYLLFTFDVKAQELENYKRAGKTAKIQFNDGFVTINCFHLLQLLTRISAS